MSGCGTHLKSQKSNLGDIRAYLVQDWESKLKATKPNVSIKKHILYILESEYFVFCFVFLDLFSSTNIYLVGNSNFFFFNFEFCYLNSSFWK